MPETTAKPTHLKHAKNGSIYPWTDGLSKNRNMEPCDKDGHLLVIDTRPDPYADKAREELRAASAETKVAAQGAVLDDLDKLDRTALVEFAELNDVPVDKRATDVRLRDQIRQHLAGKPAAEPAK